MYLNDFNYFSILFFILIFYFLINFNNNLKSLIVSEFVWILLYVISINMSFNLNNIVILSLSLFFLVFSAVEISVGLVLISLQKTITQSITTHNFTNKVNFNIKKFLRLNYIKKYKI